MSLTLLSRPSRPSSTPLGFEYYDNIIANEMDRWKGIKGHPTALKEAYDKGEKVARVLEQMNTAEGP